ncbi:MAG: cell division protein ZipA [Halieaceae bacterium]|jgi:cell division protein ZipA
MDLGIRDWMLVIGAALIAIVLLDALRRIYGQRRNEIRLNAKITRTDEPLRDDEEFNLLRELPNGGARIVRREDLSPPAGDHDHSESPLAAHGADQNPGSVGGKIAAPHQQAESADDLPSFSATEEDFTVNDPTDERSDPSLGGVEEDVPESPVSGDGKVATLDWLEELDIPDPEPEPEQRLPRATNPHVFVLNVVSRDEVGFSGTDILQILLACDLRFGDMDFFHRHEQSAGKGPIQFSVCNMINPGVFDIDNMHELHTRGLMFFVTLPGPEDMLKAFDYMYETAKTVAKNLNGDVLDETRSAITRQSLEHMRQQIRELERRLSILDRP